MPEKKCPRKKKMPEENARGKKKCPRKLPEEKKMPEKKCPRRKCPRKCPRNIGHVLIFENHRSDANVSRSKL